MVFFYKLSLLLIPVLNILILKTAYHDVTDPLGLPNSGDCGLSWRHIFCLRYQSGWYLYLIPRRISAHQVAAYSPAISPALSHNKVTRRTLAIPCLAYVWGYVFYSNFKIIWEESRWHFSTVYLFWFLMLRIMFFYNILKTFIQV